MTLPVRKLYLL